MAAALIMKEAVFFDNMSALHIAGNRAYSPRAKHVVLRYFSYTRRTGGGGQHHAEVFFLQEELVERTRAASTTSKARIS